MLDRQKLQHLVDLIQVQTERLMVQRGYTADFMSREWQITIKPRRKYTLVDRKDSGYLMIENETGIIHGICAYGRIHPKYRYGTLDTVDQWNWGDYHPSKRN